MNLQLQAELDVSNNLYDLGLKYIPKGQTKYFAYLAT